MADVDWVRLFDTGESDHVVYCLEEEFNGQSLGAEPTLHAGIRAILLPSLERYIERYERPGPHIEAAQRLQEFASALADRIEARRILESDPAELERLWLAFVAHGAGYRIYHDLPKERKSKRVGGQRSAESRRQKRIADTDIAAKALNRLTARNPVKHFTLADIEAELNRYPDPSHHLKLRRLKKLTRGTIVSRSLELRNESPSPTHKRATK